jgi:alpha/beta superfamily hydrolase
MGVMVFNFSGTPGSDNGLAFAGKTVSQELQDVKCVLNYMKQAHVECTNFHLIGLSTGAIIASLARGSEFQSMLRAEGVHVATISLLAACGAPAAEALRYDFNIEQLADFVERGYCLKEFWLPVASPSNPPGAELVEGEGGEWEPIGGVWIKHCLRLNRTYMDDFLSLNTLESIGIGAMAQGKGGPVPLLVIHGGKDSSIPIEAGRRLFTEAVEPKEWLELPRANHLFSSSKDLKKAFQTVLAFQAKYTASD